MILLACGSTQLGHALPDHITMLILGVFVMSGVVVMQVDIDEMISEESARKLKLCATVPANTCAPVLQVSHSPQPSSYRLLSMQLTTKAAISLCGTATMILLACGSTQLGHALPDHITMLILGVFVMSGVVVMQVDIDEMISEESARNLKLCATVPANTCAPAPQVSHSPQQSSYRLLSMQLTTKA